MQIKRLRIDKHLCLVDFDIRFATVSGGSSTILIGENGAGKSTMIECILNILMSFDSPAIEKQIDYSYSLEYEYAQKSISIIKSGHAYRITADDSAIEGSYRKVRSFAQKNSLFPQRVVAFYSGTNNKLFPNIKVVNTRYTCLCRDTLRNFLKSMNDDSERFIPNFPKRKYNYCEEGFTPVYLLSILCGQKSFEKSYLIKACHFDKVKYVDMVVNTNKVEQIFGRGRFEGDVPTGLYYLTDFIDYRFTDLLRRGFMYSSNGKSYFQITNIDSVNIDSIAILEFFEKLYSLFETRFEVTVTQGESNVKCSEMSEGQRQLIKILGMLGICKTEDCLVLMDEPDAYMNPRWKYEIKETMDNSLRDAINTQAIVATHDPLVINGVPKEFIRIFTHNENLVSNNGYYFTKVIVPTEDTEGMGIDGLLQSEYYGLSSVLDSETKDKMDEKHRLLIKKKDGTITDNEKYKLLELTNDLENMSFTRNIPTDSYYDEYVAAMHKIYSYGDGGKNDMFPLKAGTPAATQGNNNDIPILLDPCVESDVEIIDCNEAGEIIALSNDPYDVSRVEISKRIYNWNCFNIGRKKIRSDSKIALQLFEMAYELCPDKMAPSIKQICKLVHPDTPYSSFAKRYIKFKIHDKPYEDVIVNAIEEAHFLL